MESNGWILDVHQSLNTYTNQCGGDTWFGWSYPQDGSAKYVFTGWGEVIVNYGNCYGGVVKVFHNTKQISSAQEHVKEVLVRFRFSDGDVLKFTEYKAIIKLNSIQIKCTGK